MGDNEGVTMPQYKRKDDEEKLAVEMTRSEAFSLRKTMQEKLGPAFSVVVVSLGGRYVCHAVEKKHQEKEEYDKQLVILNTYMWELVS
jgi:hypothetical protein